MGVPYAPKIRECHIPATGDPIHFMFGSRVGFSGTADRTALFTVRTNLRWRPPPCWKISSGDIFATGRPIHFMFGYRVRRVFGDGESNGAIFDSNKFKMAAAAILDNFESPYLRNGS